MKYIRYVIISFFSALSGFLSASGLPISNDTHKHTMYWAKAAESEAKYSELALSLVPCPPPLPIDSKSNKAKVNPVVRLKAVKRTDEYPSTRRTSLVVIESDEGVKLRRFRRVYVNQQNQQNQSQINNTVINQQNA